MDFVVCSREYEKDYTWDCAHASPGLAEWARNSVGPTFEGSLTTSRYSALLRRPNDNGCVILAVSVSTERSDFRHRPIRTMAILRAETPKEISLLSAFFIECLQKNDNETLYNPNSSIAKAVESIYQEKSIHVFLEYCRTLSNLTGKTCKLTGNWAVPRDNFQERKKLSESIPFLLSKNHSIIIAITDRNPEDVTKVMNDLGRKSIVWVFSKATSEISQIPYPMKGGVLEKHRLAAAIGIALVIIVISITAATSKGCSTSSPKDEVRHEAGSPESRESSEPPAPSIKK